MQWLFMAQARQVAACGLNTEDVRCRRCARSKVPIVVRCLWPQTYAFASRSPSALSLTVLHAVVAQSKRGVDRVRAYRAHHQRAAVAGRLGDEVAADGATSVWPSAAAIASPTWRAAMSVVVPEPNGMTSRKAVCAQATPQAAPRAAASVARRRNE